MVEAGRGRLAAWWGAACVVATMSVGCGEDRLIDWPLALPDGKPLTEKFIPTVIIPPELGAPAPLLPPEAEKPEGFGVLAQGGASCAGEPVQLQARALSGIGPWTFLWEPAEGLSDPTAPDPVATGVETRNYTVTVTDATGQSAEATVLVERRALPVAAFSIVGADNVACAGEELVLDGSASSASDGGALTYAWDLDGTPESTEASGASTSFLPSADSTLTLTVTDAGGCSASVSQPYTVRPLPQVSAGTDGGLCLGGSVRLGGPAQPGLTYAWSPAAGLSDPTASDPLATPGADVSYTVTATDGFGCAASDTVQLAVNPLPVADAGPDREVARGGEVRLVGSASGGTPGYSFAWTPANTLDNAAVAQPLASPNNDTTYQLTVTDANGCVGADTASVAVRAGLFVSASEDLRLCLDGGTSVEIGASASGGVGTLSYSWTASPGCSGCIDTPNAATTTVRPTQTTTFTVTVRDANGTTATDSVVVEVRQSIAAFAGPDRQIQRGGVVQIGTTPQPGYSYEWSCDNWSCGISDPNVADPWVAPEGNTAYRVTVSDGSTCTGTDTVLVTMDVRVIATVPVEGYTPWPRDALIWVIFDSDMDPAFFAGNVTLWNPDTGAALLSNVHYDAATRTLEVDPQSYPQNNRPAVLQIRGGPTGVRTLAGDTMYSDFLLEYNASSMGDGAAPRAAWTRPAGGATGVLPSTDVVIQFDEPVDPQTVNTTSFSIAGVPATVSYDSRNWTATLRPTQPLQANRLYTVRADGVRDGSNNASTIGWSFTTGSGTDTTPPTVAGSSPVPNAASFDVGTPLTVTFSEAIDSATVGGVRLIDVSSGYPVAGEVIYDDATNTATFDARRILEPNRQYRLDVSGIRDQAGNQMSARYSAPFTTTQVIFLERFENAAAGWMLQQPWATHWQATRAGSSGLTDSPTGTYAASASLTATTPVMSVAGRSSVALSFWNRRLLPADQDRVVVEYSTDQTTWVSAGELREPAGWRQWNAILNTGGAARLQVRLRLVSNATVQMDGFFVDEFVVR